MTEPLAPASRLDGRLILIVGDLMLDHFVIGRVDRISPEAPVPVVQFDHEEYRLGGAANVAHNVAALGGRVAMIGVAGDDADAVQMREQLGRLGVDPGGIVTDPNRRTTRKLRVVTTRNQQVARIDYEDDREVDGSVEAEVIDRIRELSRSADAVLVSDYLKGAVSRAVAAAAVDAAQRRGIPVLIDPKVPHIDYYRGATLITPNHHEAEAVTHMRIRTSDEAFAAARRFRERAGCDAVLVTRGEHGMTLHTTEADTELAAEAREVSDVTGAGDTVIATMTLALAAQVPLVDAARLANRAAGIVVGKFGPATVTLGELGEASKGSTGFS
jgi:rfaE bifunctional protein kinase chain/domain